MATPPAKIQAAAQEPAKPAAVATAPSSPERKPSIEPTPLSPDASPNKKRPELRPQTKTPKATDKEKTTEASKAGGLPANQNRGPPSNNRSKWDSKPRDNNNNNNNNNNARPRVTPVDYRKDEKRDDRRRDDRRGPRENWTAKKDQKPDWSKNEDRVDKPVTPVHPLHCSWMFWLSLPQGLAARADRKNRWESNLKELGSNFNTVEHFWGYVHHMELPSRMEYTSSYYLFKSGIKPMWEHEDNIGGGKWVVQLKTPNHVDEVWQNIMFAIVGEAFDDSCDAITGAVVNRRRAGDRVAIWVRKSSEEVIAELGEKIKAAAMDGVDAEFTCTFSNHNMEPAAESC